MNPPKKFVEIESTVRKIIDYYLNPHPSEDPKDTMFLLLCLDGGKIPPDVAETLRPILSSLIDNGDKTINNLTQGEIDALEHLRQDVDALYQEKEATREAIESAINTPQWSKSEQAIATRFGLEILAAGDRVLDLMVQEVALSDFTAEDIIATYRNETNTVEEFCGRWYADTTKRDYGEEWDPEEGNQQEGHPPGKLLGIGQGFMVSYIIFYLYASRTPDNLAGYYKRRKIAHGKKVAKDVLRVYHQTASQ